MAYTKQNFVDQQVLTASHLNHIEDGIVANESNIVVVDGKLGARNLLDNSDFRNPINQRGQTSYSPTSANQYTIDRWKSWSSGIGVSFVSGGIKLSYSGTSSWAQFTQTLEANDWGNKKLTFAICDINNNIYCGSLTPISGNNLKVCGIGDETIGRLSFELNSNTGDLNVHIYINPSCEITLKWAALYEGEYTAETLPEYVAKGYGAELAECLRYYRQSNSDGRLMVDNAWSGAGERFEIPMRIVPTVTIYSANGVAQAVTSWGATDNVPANASNVTQTGFDVWSDQKFALGKRYFYKYTASADL